jgi:hypothetical protein
MRMRRSSLRNMISLDRVAGAGGGDARFLVSINVEIHRRLISPARSRPAEFYSTGRDFASECGNRFRLKPRGGSAIALVASADLGHSAVAVAVPIEEAGLPATAASGSPAGDTGGLRQRCGPVTFPLPLATDRDQRDSRSSSSPAAPDHSGTGS